VLEIYQRRTFFFAHCLVSFTFNKEGKQGKSVKISLKKDEAQTNELFLFMGLSGFFYHTCVCICTVDSLSHNLGSTRDLFDVVVASEQCHCKCVSVMIIC
jgi:hypothetical protein